MEHMRALFHIITYIILSAMTSPKFPSKNIRKMLITDFRSVCHADRIFLTKKTPKIGAKDVQT